MNATADCVVIGAGVIGSSVAYALARHGRRVVVVDRGSGAGHGSTSASSAVIRFHYSTYEGVSLAWESRHHWTAWRDYLGAPAGARLAAMHRAGVVVLDAPISPRSRLRELFGQVGVPYEEWSPDELRHRVPGIDTGRYWPPKPITDDAFWADADDELGAVFTPDGGFVDDPMLATQNLADAAGRCGARFTFRQPVTAIRTGNDRVTGVTLADGVQISAPVVVNCAGPWSAQVNALAGVGSDFTVTQRALRQEVHHVDAPPGFNRDGSLGPVVSDADLGIYVRSAPGDVLLVGGTEPECDPREWVDDPDRAGAHRTAALFETQVTRAARRFPELRVPPQPKGIAGVYDVTSDWTPVYDRTELDGFYVAIGTSGNQFKNAPVAGQLMTTLIDAVESGHDHDTDPVTYRCPYTGHQVGLGFFSRKRTPSRLTTDSVRG
jgi:glycine/D-amino acid oxidase-like deaminating enzyme